MYKTKLSRMLKRKTSVTNMATFLFSDRQKPSILSVSDVLEINFLCSCDHSLPDTV